MMAPIEALRVMVLNTKLPLALLKRTAFYRDARKNLKRHARTRADDPARDQAIADAMQRIAD